MALKTEKVRLQDMVAKLQETSSKGVRGKVVIRRLKHDIQEFAQNQKSQQVRLAIKMN